MNERFSTLSFVGGIMVGAILSGVWFMNGEEDMFPVLNLQPVGGASSTPSGAQSDALSVADQAAGAVVQVESVTVPPPGVWVAVREMRGETFGNVLGAVRVPGPRSSITIPLLRATLPGERYAVVLYRDDAEGTFDIARNSIYVDFDSGAPVTAYFRTAP